MKKSILVVSLACAAILAGAGCKKPSDVPAAAQVNGVTVDLPKLNEAFANSSQEIRTTVTQVGFNIRYTKYEDALMALDKLANDPSVTEDQKKVVSLVIDEVKKLANAAPAATPAQ
ncbi:MAG TPA: hypothetical protein VKY92_18210 [Verrucomicrobiae bacterium]|nr:hypothetical protein [Verrucomicrobiae bacterium]